MGKKKWYNWKMSKINKKPNWQTEKIDDDFAVPQNNKENHLQNDIENSVRQVSPEQNNNLDMNLVLACFQEKLAQLTTELIIKDATIKQLTNILNNMKGQ